MKQITILFVILVGFFSSACVPGKDGKSRDTIYKSIFGESITLYKHLDVTNDWQEVNLIQPVNDGGRVYYVTLKIGDWQDWRGWQACSPEYKSQKPREYWFTHLCDHIVNPQGEEVNLEIEMVDEAGKSYKLYPTTANDYGIKFNFNTELKKGAITPKHINFMRIKIRSRVPLKVSEIIWKRYQI